MLSAVHLDLALQEKLERLALLCGSQDRDESHFVQIDF